MKEIIKELYEELKGTREKNGSLTVSGFDDEAYENLYLILLENLAEVFDGNYYGWYSRTNRSFCRYKKAKSRRYDTTVVQEVKNIEDHTTREQLSVIKYWLYRRVHGVYTK